MDDSDRSYWRIMADFLNALNCVGIFLLTSWSFLNIVCELVMIRNTHVFLTFLSTFSIATFSLDVFKCLTVISFELLMFENVFVVVISDLVEIIHIELPNKR